MTELAVGSILYHQTYWNYGYKPSKRQMQKFTICKINEKTYGIKNVSWKIGKSEIGKKYFISKKDAYKNALILHEQAIIQHRGDSNFNLKVFQKEVKYLKKMIKECEQ